MKAGRDNRQRGAFAVMFAIFLIALMGFISLSMDLSQLYIRQTELQGVADAAAVAAARELNGTMPGVSEANEKAGEVVTRNSYLFTGAATWSSDALSFAASVDGPWIPYSAVNTSNVGELRYASVDTGNLSPDPGVVQLIFNAGAVAAPQRNTAVAAATGVQMVPLAVCAIDARRHIERPGGQRELLEHGFRRGVSYNLLDLNPFADTPLNFVVNPVDFPPAPNRLQHFDRATVAPFACSGTMPLPPTRTVYVKQPFPSYLAAELNSRFGLYSASECERTVALPDKNIRLYKGANVTWMSTNPKPTRVSAKRQFKPWPGPIGAASYEYGLRTVADDGTASVPDEDYGVLWAYGRPVQYDPGAPGYAGPALSPSDWKDLYPATPDLNSTWPETRPSPYRFAMNISPSGIPFRRVMGVPLLSCPVAASGEATVLAIGRFMLSDRAINDPVAPVIEAEFGGLVTEWGQSITAGIVR